MKSKNPFDAIETAPAEVTTFHSEPPAEEVEAARIETETAAGEIPVESAQATPPPNTGRKPMSALIRDRGEAQTHDESGIVVSRDGNRPPPAESIPSAERPRSPAAGEEVAFDLSLRPRSLDDFVGQQRLKQILGMSIEAARQRGEVLDHVLFAGPPGLGKTSLAHIIARELGVNLRATSGPAIERAGDLAAIVNDLDEGDVFFIDEIHRLARQIEEILYPAMEDFELNIVVGKGPGARSMRLAVKPFTLIGATTRSGLLSSPLRDRFGQHFHLDFYGRADLSEIVHRSARLLNVGLDELGAEEIAGRSRGTPRIANRLLRRVRDFAQVNGAVVVTREVALAALELLEIDACGFDRMDRAILAAIIDKFDGGPVGVESLAAAVGEEADTIGEVYEPYLLQEGYVARTARGRVATQRAYTHLGRTRRGPLI